MRVESGPAWCRAGRVRHLLESDLLLLQFVPVRPRTEQDVQFAVRKRQSVMVEEILPGSGVASLRNKVSSRQSDYFSFTEFLFYHNFFYWASIFQVWHNDPHAVCCPIQLMFLMATSKLPWITSQKKQMQLLSDLTWDLSYWGWKKSQHPRKMFYSKYFSLITWRKS